MADKPINMQAWEVETLLGTRKTQARIPITRLHRFGKVSEFGLSDTDGYDWHFRDKRMSWNDLSHSELQDYLPYAVGDHLWVRESFYIEHGILNGRRVERADYAANYMAGTLPVKCKPCTHMPRWASRITLIVTDVRVQRLQEISEDDAVAEGTSCWVCGGRVDGTSENDCACFHTKSEAIQSFQVFWDSLNAKRGYGWDENPWVAAYTFTVHQQNIDALGAD